ncbi:MAG: lipocalin-like domain-containing protein [Bacteroidales bacterium]|nr:lipocalin-like domain-containing protein [Bacteroidales bacterium]
MKSVINLSFFFLLLVSTSCSKDYDTRLRGKWQMKSELNSVGSHPVDSVYYNFDNHIFQIQAATQAISKDNFIDLKYVPAYVGVFYQNDDSLLMRFVDSTFIKSVLKVPSLGWKTSERTFKIVQITNSRLVLKDAKSEYIFSKF